VYKQETAPVLAYYKAKNQAKIIDGLGSVEDIQQRILDAVNN